MAIMNLSNPFRTTPSSHQVENVLFTSGLTLRGSIAASLGTKTSADEKEWAQPEAPLPRNEDEFQALVFGILLNAFGKAEIQPSGSSTLLGSLAPVSGAYRAQGMLLVELKQADQSTWGVRTLVHPTMKTLPKDETDEAAWSSCLGRLESFQSLRLGWDGYSAPSPSAEAVGYARSFLNYLRQEAFLPDRLAPSVVGGVGFTFREGNRKAYVEFSNKGTAHVLFSDGETDPKVEKFDSGDAGFRQSVRKIKMYLHE